MAEADGQAGEGTQATSGPETTPAAPESQSASQQTTDTTGTAQTEELFFDPESIKGKPELEAAFKLMQRSFTEKTTALKSHKSKIDAYDSFMSNPAQSLQQLASQYGYKLTRSEAQEIVEGKSASADGQFEPKSWNDVWEVAEKRILERLSPFLNQVKETRQSQLEKMLDDSCPDWRVYEDKMMDTLKKHPTLVNDPVTLYSISVPPDVRESRATQAALKKLQGKAEASQLSGGSTTNQQAGDRPKGRMEFNDAVEYAKRTLASRGIRPPNSH